MITGGMIVKNEITLMRGAIETLHEFCDEVIVVDNGSTDGSGELARELGCQVISAPDLVYDNARELYLKTAKGEWIFSLDADERMSPEACRLVTSVISCTASDVVAYSVPLFHYNGHGRWAYLRVPRLIRNHRGIQYDGSSIHSSPKASIAHAGRMSHLFAPIHHLDSLTFGRAAAKRARNIDAIEKELRKGSRTRHEQSTLKGYLAVEHMALGDWHRAKHILEEAVQGYAEGIPRAPLYFAFVHRALGNDEAALEMLEKLKPIQPGFREQYFVAKSELLYKQGDLPQLLSTLVEGLKLNPFAVHLHLGMGSLLAEVDPDRSIFHSTQALLLNPWLKDPSIYRAAEGPNIFEFQNCVPSWVSNVFDQTALAHACLGETQQVAWWREFERSVISGRN